MSGPSDYRLGGGTGGYPDASKPAGPARPALKFSTEAPAAAQGAGQGQSEHAGPMSRPRAFSSPSTGNASSMDQSPPRRRAQTAVTFASKEDAATKIQAQLRRQMASEATKYALACKALNHIESKTESDTLEANKSYARAAAILEGEGLSPSAQRQPLGLPGTPKPTPGSEPSRLSLFQLQLAEQGSEASPSPVSTPAKGGGPGVPKIEFEADRDGCMTVSTECLEEVVRHIKKADAEPLAYECVRQLILHATELLRKTVRSALLEVSTPPSPGQIVVMGDTHGQLNDLLWVFFKNGPPSESNVYILNGDVADRGKNAVEIFVLALMYKLCYPQCLHINRGNHEDRSMNESYGFLDECVNKWGLVAGLELYELFNVFFEHLPIFCLVDAKVFIVHGGLGRFQYTLEQLRRANFRRPLPEPGPASSRPADALLFDSVWADPMPNRGYGTSARGQNIITWGPDITQRFLVNNGLRLLVRSHEVPQTGRGYDYQHGGKCLTVFSASNYCGYAGNLGSVLLLTRDEEDRLEEHWAPPLEELRSLEADAESAITRIKGETQKTIHRMRRRKSSEAMEQEVLRRVQELVVKHKTELFEYFTLIDSSPRGVFTISAAQWREGCAAVLGEALPWVRLQDFMHVAQPDGSVHYANFLTRYRVAFEASYGVSATGWERAVWSKIMETLLRADLPLREALAALDATNNGIVSPTEFGRLLESCGVAISPMQARALLRTFAAHGKETTQGKNPWEVSLWDVLARLQITMPVAPAHANKDSELAKWAVPMLRPVASAVLDDAWRRLADQDAVPEEWPAARLLAVWFEDADKSMNGYLECHEFVDALEALAPAIERAGCPADRASLANIGKYCDVVGNGRINYFELLNGLTWEDSLGPEFQRDMLESINSSMYFNMPTIRRALQRFDAMLTGRVKVQEFIIALRAVHTALAADRSADQANLTRQQISAIADNIPQEPGGIINYEKFFASFRIVDMATGFESDY